MKKPILIGCGSIFGVFVLGFIALVIWTANSPEGGVRSASDIEPYALESIEKNHLVNDSEELLAYYDATISLDGSEAALITNKRVVYFKNQKITEMLLSEVHDIKHRQETLIGDTFEIYNDYGNLMKVTIAPFNQADTFHNVLLKAWEFNKKTKAKAQ